MLEFSLLWHAGHLMEAGDAGAVCWTEEPSISDSSSVIYYPLSPNIFLSLKSHYFLHACRVTGSNCTSAQSPFAFMCKNLTKNFAISGKVFLCLLQNYSLPTPSNVTSLPKWELPIERPAAVSLVSLQDPSSAGKWIVCIYVPRSDSIQNCTFLFAFLHYTGKSLPAPIRDSVKQGSDTVPDLQI